MGLQALAAHKAENINFRDAIRQASDNDLFDTVSAFNAQLDVVPLHDWEAMRSTDAVKWRQAMEEEMSSFIKNGTWKLVELPTGANLVDNRWVYAHKLDAQGKIIRFKARLVAKGFSQRPGVDYSQTFAPTARPTSQRLLFAIAAQEGLDMQKLDITTAFLHGKLEEDVYMRQPRGFEMVGKEKLACKLVKALYDLKQAARQWFLAATFKQQIAARFPCRDEGELSYHLGVQITQNKTAKTVTISQARYAQDLIKRAGLGTAIRKVSTPMVPNAKLIPRATTSEPATDKQRFQELVGSLRYLAEWTRPDIPYAVGQAARHLHDPGESHLQAVMHIYRYIAGTIDKGLSYTHRKAGLNIWVYTDASWAEDGSERRSTSGWLTVANGTALSWRSCKQELPASSTTEAEWIAGFEGAKEVKWLRQLLQELDQTQIGPTDLFIDNAPVLNLIANPVHHERTKHIDLKAYYLRYLVEQSYVKPQYVQTSYQLADCLTKSFGAQSFSRLIQQLGLVHLESTK